MVEIGPVRTKRTKSVAGLKPRAKDAKSCGLGTETVLILDALRLRGGPRERAVRPSHSRAEIGPVRTNQTKECCGLKPGAKDAKSCGLGQRL